MTALLTRASLISLPLVVGGCAQPSFIGELRCRGEQTVCQTHDLQPLAIDGTTAERDGETRELDLVWQRQVAASSVSGCALTNDGALTVLVEIQDRDESGPLLVRYDSDGQELSRDESLLTGDPDLFGLRLATDGDSVYLAEVRVRNTIELGVHRLDEDGRPRLVFRDLDASLAEGFAVLPGGDVFVAGPFASSGFSGPSIELTRYAPDGSVVYRQDALAREPPTGDDETLRLTQGSFLAVDSDGLAYVITRAASGGDIGLAALDERGNLRWHVALSLSPIAQLALGQAQQPFVVGATGSFGELRTDGYALYRLDRRQPAANNSWLTLGERRATSSPDRLGIAVDAQGRSYVLADVELPGGGMRHGVERYSADLSRRESFALPGGTTPSWLHIANDGDLYIAGGERVARIAMPAAEP